jgi:hypothetical protein
VYFSKISSAASRTFASLAWWVGGRILIGRSLLNAVRNARCRWSSFLGVHIVLGYLSTVLPEPPRLSDTGIWKDKKPYEGGVQRGKPQTK